jgi:hypothetical protein
MNIVDLITSQLSGEVLGKLGGLVGASESQTKSATTAAVPAILASLGKLAASSGGADRLASAMGGLDLGTLGNLVGALSGAGAPNIGRSGGDLLGSLLGSGGLSMLVKVLGAFVKMNPDMTRKLVGYLAPIVLGMIAKQFTGRPDAMGVSRLFSEQQSNISRAIPAGLSLADVGEQKSGMPSWLPLAALVALAAAAWYLLDQKKVNQNEGVEVIEEVVVTQRADKPVDGTQLPTDVTDALKVATGALKVGKDLNALFGGLTDVLGGVTNAETAKTALPKLKDFGPALESIQDGTAALSADERPAIAKLVGESIGPLEKLIDTVLAIPGVKDLLGPVLTPMVDALSKLGR